MKDRFGVGIVDPASAGTHHFAGQDTFGITYTCAGGFFDFGHARDTLDQTRFHYYHLTQGGQNKPGGSYRGFYLSGALVKVKAKIPDDQVLETAASLAYDESVFHEIETWYQMDIGGHHSSFSPEDLVSNFLGTWVARKAIPMGGDFDTAATTQLKNLLTQFGARPPADTRAAFAAITGRWIIPTKDYNSGTDLRYLLRRSFEVDPVVPWLVPNLGFCTSTTWPSSVPKGFSTAIKNRYDISFIVPAYASADLGKTLQRSTFAGAMAKIKTEAAQPRPDPPGVDTAPTSTSSEGPRA